MERQEHKGEMMQEKLLCFESKWQKQLEKPRISCAVSFKNERFKYNKKTLYNTWLKRNEKRQECSTYTVILYNYCYQEAFTILENLLEKLFFSIYEKYLKGHDILQLVRII